jgi:hypothetical protein
MAQKSRASVVDRSFELKTAHYVTQKVEFFQRLYDYHFFNSESRFSFSLKVHSYWLFTLTRKIASFLFFVSLIYFNMKNIFILIELVLLMYLRKTIKKVYIYLYSY